MNSVKRVLLNGRSILAAAGVAVGIFSIVLISVLGETGSAHISEVMTDMGINSVMVQAQSAEESDLTDNDIAVLSDISGVRKAMPLMGGYTQCTLLGKENDCMVWGVSEDAHEIISLSAEHGRLINESDIREEGKVCVIDSEIAEEAYGRSNITGKSIKLLVGGSYEDFTIVGIASSGVSPLQNMLSGIIPHFAYIPFTTMQALTGRTNYDKIAVLTEPEADSKAVSEQITVKLDRDSASRISINDLQQHRSQLSDILVTVKLLLTAIAGISILVSGITVMTTMLSSVNERRREIGIKKAIGARNSTLAAEFLKESLILTSAGGISGIAAGFLIASIGCAILGVSMSSDNLLIISAFAVSLLNGMIFTVYPAIKAANMPPVEALRQ